ncbi:MAG: Minf_1886 family protein [Candidatus Omnitrophota bacterium]
MKSKEDLIIVLNRIWQKDNRYKIDAYSFVLAALNVTMEALKRNGHVSGQELMLGIKDFAIREYGRLARTVFEHWGIKTTEDFGYIVFNMVEAGVLGKTESDSIDDFKEIFDFKKEFEDEYPF